MLKLQETHLLDILPPNLASDPIISNAAKAIDAELTAVTQLSRTVLILARIDELPEEVIDLLAKQFKVDFYDANTPLPRKRELVRTSIAWHRIKGTPAAVQQVVDTLIDGAMVQEYWEYGGKPYFFKVGDIKGPLVSSKTIDATVRAIYVAKNTRSHLDGITFVRRPKVAARLSTATYVHKRIQVTPRTIGGSSGRASIKASTTVHIFKEVKIDGRLAQ